MIMAGRGKRFLDTIGEPVKVGVPQEAFEPVDKLSLIEKISEIDLNANNPSVLDIVSMFKKLCTTKEILSDVISELHIKSLDDEMFGEKVVRALEEVSNLQIEGTLVRNEILPLLQSDFDKKEEISETNPKKFINAVMLLGNIYNRFKVCGKPIKILAFALFEYFNLLLKVGKEEELKTLTKQILINGMKLSETSNYPQLMINIRDTLLTKDLNKSCKCWIILILDYMSSNFQPLKDELRDFYVTALGGEYKKLEGFIQIPQGKVKPSPTSVSPADVNNQGSTSPQNKKLSPDLSELYNAKKKFTKKFSNMSVKSCSEKKNYSPPDKNHKRDIWKSSGNLKRSGHDDRFEREENFYGIQKPRQLKPELHKKASQEKSSKKGFDIFKTDGEKKVESELSGEEKQK